MPSDSDLHRLLVGELPHTCQGCESRVAGIFCNLDAPRLAELDRLRQVSVYPAGAAIYMEADLPRAAYCVCSGSVKLSTTSLEGRTVILGIAVPGDVLGVRSLLLRRAHDQTAETLEQTQLCFIWKDDFLGFLTRNGDVSLRLAQRLSDELYEAYRKVCGVALKQSPERLTEVLLALCQTYGERTPEGINLRTNLCQEELAELVGVSKRSLARTLARLRCLGIIECRRRSIIVRDHLALRNWLPPQRFF